MTKPLMVGEAPSPSDGVLDGRPLEGNPSRKMSEWSGIDVMSAFDTVNLLDVAPKRRGKGTHWTPDEQQEAMRKANRLLFSGYWVYVLLGKRVAAAFGAAAAPYYMLIPIAPDGQKVAVVIPHPSGVNHLYNEEEHRKAAGAWIRWASGQPREETKE